MDVSLPDATRGATRLRGPRDPDRVPTTRALGDAVRSARLAAGLNRAELARRAGVQFDQIKVIENCVTRTVARATAAAVMAVLGIDEVPQEPRTPAVEMWWTPPSGNVVPRRTDRSRLHARRRNQNLTQNELARAVGATTSSVQWLEYVEHTMMGHDAALIARVASVLEVRPSTLLGRWLLRAGFAWVGNGPGLDVDWDALPLGRKSDCEIADETGLKVRKIERERNRRGVAPYQGPRRRPTRGDRTPPPWTAEQLHEELGAPPLKNDHATHRVDWSRVPLGCTTDKEIARWLGVDPSTVVHARQARDVPRFEPVLWDQVPLGDTPDTVVAVWTGTTTAAVHRQRKKQGIPAAPRKKRRDVAGAVYKMNLDPRYLAPRELRLPDGTVVV